MWRLSMAAMPNENSYARSTLAPNTSENSTASALNGAVARAARVAGDEAAYREALARGREALDGIADPEDRRLIESDLDELEGAAA